MHAYQNIGSTRRFRTNNYNRYDLVWKLNVECTHLSVRMPFTKNHSPVNLLGFNFHVTALSTFDSQVKMAPCI